MTRALFNVYWRQFCHTLTDLRPGQLIPLIVIGLAALIVIPLLFSIFFLLKSFLTLHDLKPLFSGVLLFAMAMTVLFAVPQVFKHLFSASDVELLFTLPIPTRNIFWLKYVQSFWGTGGFISVLLWLAFSVLGLAFHVSWWYYPVVIVVSLSVTVFGMALAYLLNLILIQILPASRAKELMVLMSSLAGVFVYVSFQLPNLLGTGRYGEDLLALMPEFPGWLPTTWGANALTAAAMGGAASLLWAGVLVLVAAGLSIFASTLVERGFRTGWIRLSTAGRKRKKKRHSQPPKLFHPVIFIGLKEWRTLQRDLREWLSFLPLLFVMIIPTVQFLRSPEDIKPLLHNPLLSWVLAQVVLLGFLALIIGSFTAASVAREGKSAWVLRTLPLNGWHIALGKLWIHWLIPCVLVFALEVVAGVFLSWSPLWMLAGVGTYAMLSLGMSGIGLWIGTIGAKYNPDNPQERLHAGTGFLLLGINVLYLLTITIPVLMVLIPAVYADFFASVASNGAGLFKFVATLFSNILNVKLTLGNVIIFIGVLILMVIVSGITYITVYISAKRFDAGIQITTVQGKSGKN